MEKQDKKNEHRGGKKVEIKTTEVNVFPRQMRKKLQVLHQLS